MFLPTANCRIDVKRVDFDAVASAPRLFAGDQSRAAAEEGIEHNLTPHRTIQNRIRHQSDRFDRWMHGQEVALLRPTTEIVDARVIPNICPVASVFAELDVIAVRHLSVLEHENELVLTAIERSHAAVMFHPYADVDQIGISALARSGEFPDMTPVHADVVDRTSRRVIRQQSAGLPEKVGKLSFGHLSTRHRELTVRNSAFAGYMPLNRHVVRRIGKHE